MSTLSDLLPEVTAALGTENTGYFTENKKIDALNRAGKQILTRYDIQEFIDEENIVFTSGSGSLPATFYRKVGKRGQGVRDLWNTTSEQDYQRVDVDRFGDEIDYTWTEKEGSVLVWPADTVTLRLRFIKKFVAMTISTSESGFPLHLEQAHAYWAAYLLLFQRRDYDAASLMQQKAKEELEQGVSKISTNKGDVRVGSMELAILRSSPSRGALRDNQLYL